MSTPIKREDIRKGDQIRVIEVYTAQTDHSGGEVEGITYELIERPVVLPNESGTIVTFDRRQNVGLTGGVAVRTGQNGWLVAGEAEYRNDSWISARTGLAIVEANK